MMIRYSNTRYWWWCKYQAWWLLPLLLLLIVWKGTCKLVKRKWRWFAAAGCINRCTWWWKSWLWWFHVGRRRCFGGWWNTMCIIIVAITRFTSSPSMASAYNKSYHCNHGCTHYAYNASNNMHYIESFAMMACRKCCMSFCWLLLPYFVSRCQLMVRQ